LDLGIKGRRAIVCASSRGLGKACARALAEAGCEVFLNGRDEATLNAAAKEIADATGATVHVTLGDVGAADVRAALLAACPEADILVNNNGGPPPKPFASLTREDILAGVEANMLTPILLAQAVIEGMAKRGFGRIVNITSGSVRAPIAGLDVSSGARAGLTAFLAAAARAHVANNVTINSIQPGVFDTDRIKSMIRGTAERTGQDQEALREARKATIPAKRFGTPEEFGALCGYLCSAQAGFVTGQNILIDGGAFPGAF